MRRSAALLILVASLLAGAPRVQGAEPLRFSFDTDADTAYWDLGAIDQKPAVAPAAGIQGNAAVVPFGGKTSATLRLRDEMDLSQYRYLEFQILLPNEPAHMHVSVYLIGARNTWYQTWRAIRPEPGKWQKVRLDLDRDAGLLEPVGHSEPWGPYPARQIKVAAIQVFADAPVKGNVLIDDVQFIGSDAAHAGNAIYNLETSGDEVPQYGKFEATFELAKTYANPYDPAQIEITGEFTPPGGQPVVVPGFYYQGYERRLEQKSERLVPVGSPKWKVRFSPTVPGDYSYRIIARDGEELSTSPATFRCAKSDNPGFVRVSSDPRYFEFDSGKFFYPIGHNIPATFNVKAAEILKVEVHKFEGTFAFERYLDRMAAAGENFARVWMGSWSFGLEGSNAYHPAYEGVGRYNQENAWRLDFVVDRAEALGIYMQVALATFGNWRNSNELEGDWGHSPYNKANGGPLAKPDDFWKNAEARETYQKMVRYAMARWGYATHLASWEVCNEINLVSQYKKNLDDIRDWHTQCAATIAKFDPNKHMITTNFSQFNLEPSIIELPVISYSSTNHYCTQMVNELRDKIIPDKLKYHKPAIMAECGHSFQGSTPEATTLYLHLGLWSTYMMPFAASGMPWWWDFIDDRNLYPMFTPLVQFAQGEDRRNRDLNTRAGRLNDASGELIADVPALTLQNDSGGYFWMYERRLMRGEGDPVFTPAPRKGTTLEIPSLKDGMYAVEFWDTKVGGKVSELTAEAKDGNLRVSVPEFTSDLAGKFRRLSDTPPTEKSAQ